VIHHAIVVLITLPLSLLSQSFFRRSSDSDSYFDQKAIAAAAAVVMKTGSKNDGGDLPVQDINDELAALSFSINGGETII